MKYHLQTLLSGALAAPVKWGVFGQEVGAQRVSLFQSSGIRNMSLSGKGLMRGRVQVDCYGATSAEAETLARGVRAVLEGYVGGPVLGMFLDTTRDNDDDDAGYLPRVSMTFSVTYRD